MNLTLWPDFINVANELTESERGQLLLAILEFLNGKDENELTGAVRIAYVSLRTQVIRDNKGKKEYSEEQSRKGKLGGRPKKETDTVSEKPSENEKAKKAAAFSAKTEKPSKSEKPKVEIETENEIETEDKIEIEEPPKSPTGDSDVLNGFGDELREAVEDWLSYKRERRESYKPTGHKLLLSQIANKANEYGESAVAEVIRTSISSGYKGIVLDRLRTMPVKAVDDSPPFDPDDPYAAWGEGG